MIDQLDPHQETGGAFLAARPFALLWDEPGVGKTVSAVYGCDLAEARLILVLAPRAVKRHWERTFVRWQRLPRDVTVHEGRPRAPFARGVHIVTHAALANPQATADLLAPVWDVVIDDEATEHRDFTARRTGAVLGVGGLWTRTRHFWALTGDPIVNSAADLYPLAVGPWSAALRRPAPNWTDFCRRYAVMRLNSLGEWVPRGLCRAEELAAFLAPFTLRRTAASVGLRLPPLTIRPHLLDIPGNIIDDLARQLDTAGWSAAQLQARLELVDEIRDPALVRVRRALGRIKAPWAAAMIAAAAPTGADPILTFFHHTDVRDILHEHLFLAGLFGRWIDGTISRTELDTAEHLYQTGQLEVMLVQTQAGGMGLTLTRGTRICVVEPPWTATALFQAVKRAHRRGQTRPVEALVLRVRDFWLDDVIARIAAEKRQAAESLLALLTTDR